MHIKDQCKSLKIIKYNKKNHDLKTKNIEITIEDKVLLSNEVAHKSYAKYTGLYKIESIKDRNNIIISGKTHIPSFKANGRVFVCAPNYISYL